MNTIDSLEQHRIITWNVNGVRSRVFNNKTSTQLPKKNHLFQKKDLQCTIL